MAYADVHEILPDMCRHWAVGPMRLWLRHTEAEWHMSVDYMAELPVEGAVASACPVFGDDCADPPADLEWRRWAGIEGMSQVRVTPVMPDRAVMVRPEGPLEIPKGRWALFFVSIPVWLRVSVGPDPEVTLCEVPTVVLSNTWFGDPSTGELCYSLTSRARRAFRPNQTEPHCALCPVTVRNDSSEELAMDRVCLRVEHLAVYEGASQLWTNGATLRFHTGEQGGQVEFDNAAPGFEAVGPALGEPREPFRRGLLKRSFSNFKFMAGL